ncbi:hypothetical protein PRV_02680 [Mycoplasma parvum str. Indiana]|uniref:Uncharacterized protein n=1 Tax=Mycoplasma parvum str. Indiana TaxID=1403316 RepID=U5NCF4_9MOLU|nr:hypothetical protein PRV_02680 [Mycoplasma parvum str. Indiana]
MRINFSKRHWSIEISLLIKFFSSSILFFV